MVVGDYSSVSECLAVDNALFTGIRVVGGMVGRSSLSVG